MVQRAWSGRFFKISAALPMTVVARVQTVALMSFTENCECILQRGVRNLHEPAERMIQIED